MAVRVLLITQWFDPEPTFKGLVFARELVRLGFSVEVVTGFPNYPGGKLYPGYSIRLFQREVIDGVTISRVPLYPNHDQSVIGRIFNYVSFSASTLAYGLFCAKRPDVIYAYHPPLTTGIAAVLMGFFRRRPVVYDIQDMWPDTLRATGMLSNEKILALVGKICDWVYKHSDRLVVLSPGFKKLLVERGVQESKIEVIYNWCDEASIAKQGAGSPTGFPGHEKFKILFAGNMGKAQALDSVILAAEQLEVTMPDIVFIFLGGGVEVDRLKQLVASKSLSNIIFLPPIPMPEVGGYLAAADTLLVHLKKDSLFSITIPSKTQAYMMAGRPILMGTEGDAADLVSESGCGLVFEPENPSKLAEAAKALKEMLPEDREKMSLQGTSFYKQRLSLLVGATHFGNIFYQLAKLHQ